MIMLKSNSFNMTLLEIIYYAPGFYVCGDEQEYVHLPSYGGQELVSFTNDPNFNQTVCHNQQYSY